MKKQEAIILFHSMHPNFFEQEYIQSLSEEWTFDEMFLRLDEFDMSKYEKSLDTSITFGFFEGNREELLEVVEQVDSDWIKFFIGEDRVFCAYLDGKVVSVETITELAKLPSREVLLATVLSAFQAPIAAFARAVQAIVDKDGEPAAEEAAE